jgi:hypothetical protein
MTNDPRRDPLDPTTPRDRTTTERPVERTTTTERTTAADTRPLRRVADVDAMTPTEMVTWRDQVRWGPIVAGLVTALAAYILLSLLALGLGLTALQAGEGVTGGITQDLPWISTVVAGVIGLVAFFLGGWIASSTAAPAGKQAGALNGFLVWALGITFILVMGAFGLGQVFGAAGAFLGDLQNLTLDIEITPQQATEAARDSALIGFAALALPAFAATLGGWFGAQDEDERIVATRR